MAEAATGQSAWIGRKRPRHASKGGAANRSSRSVGVTPGGRQQDLPFGPVEAQKRPRHESTGKTGDLRLTLAQAAIVNLVQKGWSLFITGSAGTGKSEVLRAVARDFAHGHVATTALTGSAATALGGQTVHAWAGVGRADAPAEVLVKKIMTGDAAAYQRWCSTSLLIIDEVSMVSGLFLDKLDAVGRATRRLPKKPFGGMQVLLCGDFHQLPPPGAVAEGWAFEARCWNPLVESIVELTEILRLDANETEFAGVLNQVRRGLVDDKAWALLQKLIVREGAPTSIESTHLVPTNAAADKVNSKAIQQLSEEHVSRRLTDSGECAAVLDEIPQGRCSNLAGEHPKAEPIFEFVSMTAGPRNNSITAFRGADSSAAPPCLRLGVGAKVVLTQNVRLGPEYDLVTNGTLCHISNFCRISARLYDDAHRDFEPELSPAVRRYLLRHNGLLPRLEVPGLKKEYVIYPTSNKGKDGALKDGAGNGTVQLPLRLGWALTIHRAQGMTLQSEVVVHLQGVSNSGQAYVALSRCRSASQLRLYGGLPFRDPKTGRVAAFVPDPKVAAFYSSLKG